jgi:hypothetical protein
MIARVKLREETLFASNKKGEGMLQGIGKRLIVGTCLALVLAGMCATVQAQSPLPAPILSLSANGRTDAQGFQSSALIFDATLVNPQKFTPTASVTPVVINPQNGSWANTIQLVVTDGNGVTQNWPIHLAALPSGSLSLDTMSTGRLPWVVGPADTSTIPAGTYNVTAVLDTTGSAGTTGWSGITSDSVSVQISPPPSPSTIEQQEEQAELLATYDQLLGNNSQALADLTTFLNQQPHSVGALALEGYFLDQSGQTAIALAAYDQAVAAFFAGHTGPLPEQPDSLLIPENKDREALLSQSGIRGTPQAAIQLLGQGTQSPGVFFLDLQITNVGNDVAENVVLNRITFQTLSGTGQVFFNSILSPRFPVGTDILAVNSSATIRVFVTVQGAVGDVSLAENGTVADIFGTPTTFSQTQTIFLSGGGGNALPLTITAANATQQYGQPTPPLNNASYNGFVNGDTASSLSGLLACTTTAIQTSPVGTYPITCSGLTSPNYTITYLPGLLTVAPAPLTITASSTSRKYGQSNPSFTASFNGFVNGDNASGLSGTLSCTTAAAAGSTVGTYAITCSGLTSTNYTIGYTNGLLTITPASLTVTANSTSRQFGQANPSFTTSFGGFVNGDTVASLGGTLTCITTATPSSAAGMYPINCSGLTSTNYTITYIPGQLTVAALVCASNATASVTITRSGFSYSPILKRYAQTLTLTNTGASAITGPIYVVLDSLSSNASVYTPSGSTGCAAPLGSPYISIAGPLSTGASTTVVLHFTDPTNATISFTTRVLAGAGQP